MARLIEALASGDTSEERISPFTMCLFLNSVPMTAKLIALAVAG
jgi:hypothetical protein